MSYSIEEHLMASYETFRKTIQLSSKIESISKLLVDSLRSQGTIYWFGNGGSASDAEHLAAELSGRFALDRAPLNSISLTCNSSVVTAIANDYGFENIFSRQIDAHVQSGDIAIGISTSGKSINVLKGLKTAKDRGAVTILFTGENYRDISEFDHVLIAPSQITAQIQEAHIAIGQAICGFVESEMST
jgi:D-sedoheptulose 7-phosphate isomerase